VRIFAVWNARCIIIKVGAWRKLGEWHLNAWMGPSSHHRGKMLQLFVISKCCPFGYFTSTFPHSKCSCRPCPYGRQNLWLRQFVRLPGILIPPKFYIPRLGGLLSFLTHHLAILCRCNIAAQNMTKHNLRLLPEWINKCGRFPNGQDHKISQ